MLISLDDSIITIEHRVKTANFLLFFGGPERDGLPRRPPEQTPIVDCHGVSYRSVHFGMTVTTPWLQVFHIYHKHIQIHQTKKSLPL